MRPAEIFKRMKERGGREEDEGVLKTRHELRSVHV